MENKLHYYLRPSEIPVLRNNGLYNAYSVRTNELLVGNVTDELAAKVCPILLANAKEIKDFRVSELLSEKQRIELEIERLKIDRDAARNSIWKEERLLSNIRAELKKLRTHGHG